MSKIADSESLYGTNPMSGGWKFARIGQCTRDLLNSHDELFWLLAEGYVKKLEPLCQSPIEVKLGASLLMFAAILQPYAEILNPKTDRPIFYLQTSDSLDLSRSECVLVPQYKWRDFRIDFAVLHNGIERELLFIECDGHEFHERTKEQATSDKARDRIIQHAGIPILRFTGSEIFRDPLQIINLSRRRRLEVLRRATDKSSEPVKNG